MDEHSAWNGWLLRHGRLTDALFSGLLVFGSFYLPATILYLLGTRRADWPFWVVLAVTLPVGAGVARYVLGPGHPASGESVPGTVRSQRRRLLLALGGALVA